MAVTFQIKDVIRYRKQIVSLRESLNESKKERAAAYEKNREMALSIRAALNANNETSRKALLEHALRTFKVRNPGIEIE